MTDNKQDNLPVSEISKGDVFYKVYDDRRDGPPAYVSIVAVGRDWLTVDNNRTKRFRKETLRSEDGRATLWRSREEYEAEVARRDAWGSLRAALSTAYKVPDGISTETILTAIELIGGRKG